MTTDTCEKKADRISGRYFCMADTFYHAWQNFSSVLHGEVKREGLEMTSESQRYNRRQNFSGSEAGIVDMKGI